MCSKDVKLVFNDENNKKKRNERKKERKKEREIFTLDRERVVPARYDRARSGKDLICMFESWKTLKKSYDKFKPYLPLSTGSYRH